MAYRAYGANPPSALPPIVGGSGTWKVPNPERETDMESTYAPATGIARRVTMHEAKRAFEAGAEVLVSEHGHEAHRFVGRQTTTHHRDRSNWSELVASVRMWRNRYPNQRFYVVGPLGGAS